MGYYDDDYVYTSYDDLLAQDGIQIEAQERFGDYQGENAWIVSRGDAWGWYTDSYGSCSGCDALEGCNTQAEVEELGQGMRDGVRWFSSKDALVEYLLTKDHEVEAYDYYGMGDWFRNWAERQSQGEAA